jgi:hypothetical protein
MAFLCFAASYITSWRAVILATSAHLFFVALLLISNIPESPRFLLKNKKNDEAKHVSFKKLWLVCPFVSVFSNIFDDEQGPAA